MSAITTIWKNIQLLIITRLMTAGVDSENVIVTSNESVFNVRVYQMLLCMLDIFAMVTG
jgi:hypothetical protein